MTPSFCDVHRHDAGGGHGVGVKGDFVLLGDPGDIGDGLDGADFVVGQHDADENGVRRNGPFHRGGVHHAVLVHVQGSDPIIQEPQGAQGIEHGFVLDVGGDDVAALLPKPDGHAFQGVVAGFRAAGGEDHFLGLGVDQRRHLAPGVFQGLGGRLAHLILGGGIAQDGLDMLGHRLFHLGVQGRGGK